jgi:hypothetical protein
MKKKCTSCNQVLDEENFFWQDKSHNKRHAQCKDCSKEKRKSYQHEHYQKYKEQYIARAKNNNLKQKNRINEFIIGFLSTHPCEICGEEDIVVLDFHHTNPTLKNFTISSAISQQFSMLRLQEEISKCIVLCSNCHRRVTASRGQSYKFKYMNPN